MRKWFILFIISILPYVAHADAVQIGSLWYNLDESTMTEEVTRSYGDSYTGDIVIPSTVPYDEVTYSVTSIGERAFEECYNLTSVIISEGITKIGVSAFASCYNMTRVEIPSTVTLIDPWAFAFCDKLVSVTSKIVTPFEIEQSVFCLGSNVEEEKTVYTPSSAFLLVPSNTKSAYQALAGWSVFDGIYEGDYGEASDGTLNYRYFTGENLAVVISGEYSGLQKVTIPGSVTLDGTAYPVKAVGSSAFKNCSNLDSLIIEEGVETIGNSAFEYCYNLRYVVLPEGLKTIGSRAFVEMGSW